MRQKNYRQASGKTTIHYKLYKAKKNWLIAGIALFSFGVGTVGIAKAAPVAAATTVTEGTAPASAASSAAVSTTTSVATSSTVTSATPASQAVTARTASNASGAASSAAVSNSSVAASSATSVSLADSSAASSAARSTASNVPAANSTAIPAAIAQYQTPPMKDGGMQDEKVATVQPKSGADTTITTVGTTFVVNFNVKAGDTVTVKIDGVDVSDALFTNGPTQYAKVDNVVMNQDDSNVTTLKNQADGAIVDSIIKDGSYQQSFNLLALQNYTEYSTTATGYATKTVTDRKIQVFINDELKAQTTFQATYNVVPVRLVRANYYQDFVSYNADQEAFQLPNFGISNAKNKQAGSLSLNDLAQLNATTATYTVVMPDDFELNVAATAAINQGRPYTITQNGNKIILKYDLTATAKSDDAAVYVQGAFKGYNPSKVVSPDKPVALNTVTVDTPNVITVTQADGTQLIQQSSGNNKFSYKTGDYYQTSFWTSWPNDYISNANNHTVYPDLQRAVAEGDYFNLSVGTAAYYGSAMTNGNDVVEIPAGFTTQTMSIDVKQPLLTANETDTLPYQVTYTDGSTMAGTLKVGTNTIALTAGKTVQSVAYQYNMPNTPRLTNGQSQAEEVTQSSAYDHVDPYVMLPVVHLTLNVDPDTELGTYSVPATLTFTNNNNELKTDHDANQTIQVVDGQTNAYVTVAANAQTQTNTSRGTILTDSGTTYLSGVASKPIAGLTLSNGTTSKATDLEAQFLNEPIFYFIAPAQTTFVVNQANVTSKIPGAVLTEYTTSDGKDAYQIDLTKATSDEFNLSGDAWYRDDQPIAVTGVFRNGTVADYRADNGILERLINMFEIKADDNALEGSDDLQIFYTSKNQINDLTAGQDTNDMLTGDPNAIKVVISNPTYKIQNLSGINGYAEIQGSEDTDFSDTGRTSVYNMLDDNQFAVTVTNVADKALNNVNVLVNLPTKDDAYGSAFTVNLADNSELELPAGITVYYGTTTQIQQTSISEPTREGYVTGDAVTDWSAIRSVIVHANSVASQAALAQVSFKIQDPTQLQDVGKTAYFDTGVYADDLIPIIANKTMAAKLTVQGTATINYAFLLPDGSQVAAPQLTQNLQLGSDTVTKPVLTLADLPAGYELVGADGKALSFIDSTTDYQVGQTVNSDADYSSLNGVNGTAQIGMITQYDADGDTILIPVMDPNATTQAATINYVDQDENNALLHTDALTGLSETIQDYSARRTATLANLTAKGYVYVKQAGDALNATNQIVFDADDGQDQVTTIYLKHNTTVVTPDMPTPPTETPTGTSANDLNRTVTQTVQYVYSTGGKVAADQTQQVTFQRAAVVDQVTGQVLGYLAPSDVAGYQTGVSHVTLTDNGWTVTAGSADFKAIASPEKAGYTNDLAATQAYTVTPTTGNALLTVTYTAVAPQRALVNYVDDDANGAQVHQDILTGAPAETNAYAKVQNAVEQGLVALGYVVVGNDLPTQSIITFDDQAGDQIYTVHLKHQIQPATANLQKVVTETVTYVYANGTTAAPTVIDQVTFQRNGTVDQVTGQVTYTAWTAQAGDTTFEAKVSPSITGYTPDQIEIAAVTGLTVASANINVIVTYTKINDGGTTTPDNPGTDGGTTTPDNPGTDSGMTTPDNPGTDGGTTTPDDPGTDGSTTTPGNPGTDGGTTTPGNPGADGDTTTSDNPGTDDGTTTPDNPGTDGGTTTPDNPGTVGDAITTPADPTTSNTPAVSGPSSTTTAQAAVVATPKATSTASQQVTLTSQAVPQATTLPQTSDANETWLAAAGLTMLGSIGLLGATTLRKRRDNDVD
jgi:LPXTG-motif cell wall-anchored protein